MFVESNSRAIVKSLTWRGFSTSVTTVLVYLFTGSVQLAFAIGGLEVFGKMGLYYLHERIWNRLNFGRKEVEAAVFWLTGYSGAGKKTTAHIMEESLRSRGFKVEVLEGDKIRKIFSSTGYSKSERDEHVRRVGYLASQLEKHGIVVIVSMTSPFAESRAFARKVCKKFVEVHVATPMEECERRDPKNLWKQARQGNLSHFVGIDLPYEAPLAPEITVDLSVSSERDASSAIIAMVYKK